MRDTTELGETTRAARLAQAVRLRRITMAALVGATMASGMITMAWLLTLDGLHWLEIAILGCFAVTLPWTIIGFWNAVIGFVLLRFTRDPISTVCPIEGLEDDNRAITARTAIVMPVYNEDTEMVFRHLRQVTHSLDATGKSANFDIFLLSDTRVPEIAAEEEQRFAAWRAEDARPSRLHYRRRTENSGFKAGNVMDFCERWGEDYDYMVVLDADSLMTGEAILRLVRLMQVNPDLGILQTLAVGLPGESLFTRLFQFGMRHGMRSYTMGSAWWQGDCGPFWGHNAIIRVQPFNDHCKLPRLGGTPPLGGHILSHDQVEAALMRRAGYHVRVLPLEEDSFEINPPTLPDYIKRDLRWCQGNLQYFGLLGLPDLKFLSRIQLLLAIIMYLSAPAWLAFVGLGVVNALVTDWNPVTLAGTGVAVLLFCIFFGFSLAPRFFGILDTLLSDKTAESFGGRWAVARGAVSEFLFGLFMGPIAAVSQTVFMAGLIFGRTIRWNAQARDGYEVSWGQALRGLWLHTLVGAGTLAVFWFELPHLIYWALPMFGALLLAIPFSVLTAKADLSRRAVMSRLCATPEELRARLAPFQGSVSGSAYSESGAYMSALKD